MLDTQQLQIAHSMAINCSLAPTNWYKYACDYSLSSCLIAITKEGVMECRENYFIVDYALASSLPTRLLAGNTAICSFLWVSWPHATSFC